jgi:hypothetical protein
MAGFLPSVKVITTRIPSQNAATRAQLPGAMIQLNPCNTSPWTYQGHLHCECCVLGPDKMVEWISDPPTTQPLVRGWIEALLLCLADTSLVLPVARRLLRVE